MALADLRFQRTYSLDEVWRLILLIDAGIERGNWQPEIVAFAEKERAALHEIHDAAAKLEGALA